MAKADESSYQEKYYILQRKYSLLELQAAKHEKLYKAFMGKVGGLQRTVNKFKKRIDELELEARGG